MTLSFESSAKRRPTRKPRGKPIITAAQRERAAQGARRSREEYLVDRHIGEKIRLRRAMLGLSQEKLAQALGLTFQQVQKYERGTNRVGGSRLHQIAGVLDVGHGYFFEGLDREGRRLSPREVAATPSADDIETARLIAALPPHKKRAARALLRTLGKEERSTGGPAAVVRSQQKEPKHG